MTRTKSLALLHQWARPETDNPHLAISMAERDARSHGAAAVRAIRNDPPFLPCRCSVCLDYYIARESRLAFRAALNAVGLKTL